MAFIDTNKHVVTLFLEQVKATPDAPALADPNCSYTYADLDDKVTALARRLRSQGVGRKTLVGILLPHTADFIIACLATLRAGGAYLILELAYPSNLLNNVIQDAKPPLLITYRSEVKKIESDVPLIVLDEKEQDVDSVERLRKDITLPMEYDQDVMAFVSYSSGTTGRPKGIVNNDRPGVLSYNQRFTISDQGPGHRIACNTFFIWEMFRPLTRGAMAFAVPDSVSYDPVGLVELLAAEHITETLMTPTLLASILAQYPDKMGDRIPKLRVLWITGEVVTTDLAKRALHALPHVRLLNSYSTSETWDTAIGEMKDVLHDAEQSKYCSVGKPLGVNKVYILDEHGNRLDPGHSGEIFIGGPVLGLGYLGLPDVTARTFVPDPFSPESGARMYRTGDLGRILPSGSLEITGRIGSMIKLRGYSVVPAIVQMTIVSNLAVRNCAVVSHGDGLERRLIAYFVRDRVSDDNDRPDVMVDDLAFSPNARRILSENLAEYMIPTYWIELPNLPADPVSGKIDKKRLPVPTIAEGSHRVINWLTEKNPSNASVETIAQIWAITLKIPITVISSEHTFFDMGGHSLSLATLSRNLAKAFGIAVPVARLAESPSLEGHLSAILAAKDKNSVSLQTDLAATLSADCRLEDEIRPKESKWCSLKDAKSVLLTGATGFLGTVLLHDMLKTTSATIMCLVRHKSLSSDHYSHSQAESDIRQRMLDKELWSDSFTGRFLVICGDLSERYFGLPYEEFRQLATRVEVIVHAAAWVNLIYPYSVLRKSNVCGTVEVLRFASLAGSAVHHVSTNSVLHASPMAWLEKASLGLDEVVKMISDGYGQTKWVAEQLMVEAYRRGFPVRIYRAGNISGHSVTGLTNSLDLQTALIAECIELGYHPDVKEWRVEATPVDFVSKAIIHLCNIQTSRLIFHLGDPNPIPASQCFKHFREIGCRTQPLEWDAWMALWTEKRSLIESKGGCPVEVLRAGMPSIEFLTDIAVLDFSETKPYIRDLARPELDVTLLETYARHWHTKGWISQRPASREILIGRVPHSGPLSGRVALITGASSGIGAATAFALAQEGVHLVLAARRIDLLESIKTKIHPCGIKVMVQPTDVTDGKQIAALINATVKALGPIDILIACAGVMYYTLMKNAQQDQWERTIDVNCKGLLNCLSGVVPDMVAQKGGHVVAISSDAGRKVFPGLGVYSGSKFFVEAILQSLRLETVGTGLRVTSIQPGNVATDLLKLSTDEEAVDKYGKPSGARILQAEHVASAIVYALKQPKDVSVNEILIQPRDEPN